MGPKMERQISVHRSEVDTRQVSQIIEAGLNNLPQISSRTIKVFLSSTFSDMIQERNALMEQTYPKLKTFCRDKYGLEFQMMDLRWGIRDESQDDHTTIDFCLREIANCQQQSVGPCFVAFLGQKYGYRPFPPNIKADEFEKLYKVLSEEGKDTNILDLWYKKDENVKPAIYNLQPISSVIVNFNDKNPKKQEKAKAEWDITFKILQKLLRDAAQICYEQNLIDERVRDKYFVSVTEYEIYHGMIRPPQPDVGKSCFVLFRNIKNLDDNLDQRRAQKFTDVIPGTTCGKIDQEARTLLNNLKETKIPNVLMNHKKNISTLEVEWTDMENDPSDNKEYLDEFCKRFYDNMESQINKCARQADQLNRDPYVVEVIQHLTMCKTRVEVFRGRQEILQSIRKYIVSSCQDPMVLYGQSGSGKTSVIAQAYSQVNAWLRNKRPAAMLRFLGTTARSTSIRLILGCLCWQIDVMYGRPVDSIPSDYPGLVNYFHEALQLATEERPLVLFLDSLDQLSPSHNAHDLTWLPKHLPANVRIVVSTLQYEYDILENLRSTVNNKKLFEEVEPLGLKLSTEIIEDWLSGCNRTLTAEQYDVVKTALKKCSLPLYTRLIFDKICTWKSYSPISQTQLEPNVKGVINKLFDTVEKYHGETFTRHALSYLTASKSGLSDVEMEDVLSLDDEVLNDVFTYWLPPVRRIPPLLWPRLQHELDRYIIQRESNGMIVYFWYHRQFNKVVQERYLSDVQHTLYIHSMLAHYYQGTWGGGAKKAFKYTVHQANLLGITRLEAEASRMVPEQPLEFTEHTVHHQAKRLPFNLRKLSELPFHLVKSRRITDLKNQVFFNYKWLLTKLHAMSLHDILSDFRLALDSGFDEKEILLLSSTLRISGSHLKESPRALAYELTGRLLPYYDSFRDVKRLLQQCDTAALQDTCFVPLVQCFEAPRGMLTYILEDHKKIVLDLLFSKSSPELVSISRDNTIAFWDIRTGDRTRMIDVSDLQSGTNTRLHQSDNGRYLICDSDAINSPAYVFDMKTGQLIHKVGRRLTTQRRCFVVGNLLLRQKTIIDIVKGKEIGSVDDYISTKKYLTCGITPNQKYIVLGDNRETSVFNIQTRKLLVSFPGQHLPCLFVFTPDSKLCYTGYNEDCLFKIFDIDPQSKYFGRTRLIYNYLNAFPDMANMDSPIYANELSSIALNPQDDNQVLISIKRCQLILLDVVRQTSRRVDMSPVAQVGEKTFVTHARLTSAGKFIVAAVGTYMHIWCAEKLDYITGVNIHSIERFPISVSTQRNLIATASTLHTAIKTWDLDKIYLTKETGLKIYTNPTDTLACSQAGRLLFVKKYHRQNYKFIDYFGIDVWNMSTGTVQACLATGKYGELSRMHVSRDGHHMALLISTRDKCYVCAINLKQNRVLAFHRHPGCDNFVLSDNCEFLATEGTLDGNKEVRLWCLKGGELARFEDASSPVFTSDNAYLIYVEGTKTIEVFCLKTMQSVNSMLCDVNKLSRVPTLNQYILATEYDTPPPPDQHNAKVKAAYSRVSLWHISAGFMISQFQHVAPSGMKDFSKDGRICIDGYLQVFDIKSGKLLIKLKSRRASNEELSMVRLTYDGQYAVWAQDLSINVTRIHDNKPIGYICTHEKPVSLVTLDYGYIVIVGREDGHILTAKLIDGEGNLPPYFDPQHTKERLHCLVEKVIYPDGIVATFESGHQTKPKTISDSAMPKLSKDVQNALQEKAKVPHAVIKTINKTSSFGDLKEFDKDFNKRRGSSPAIHLLESGLSLGSGHSTAPCRLKKTSKSPSLTNLFAHNTMGRRKSREHSPVVQDVFSTPKAMQHTSSLLIALTDFSGGVSKIFKRKISESASQTNSPMPARRLAHSPLSYPPPKQKLDKDDKALSPGIQTTCKSNSNKVEKNGVPSSGVATTCKSKSRTSPRIIFTQTPIADISGTVNPQSSPTISHNLPQHPGRNFGVNSTESSPFSANSTSSQKSHINAKDECSTNQKKRTKPPRTPTRSKNVALLRKRPALQTSSSEDCILAPSSARMTSHTDTLKTSESSDRISSGKEKYYGHKNLQLSPKAPDPEQEQEITRL